MRRNWVKCQSGVWCKFNSVDLDHKHFSNMHGVYLIWHEGPNPAVVYVGQGKIKDRLAKHRSDQEIKQYASLDLYATWASVNVDYRDGVEGYLADIWRPKVGVAHPTAERMVVNSPWE